MTSLASFVGNTLFSNPFDDLIDKATSENLPVGSEDLPTSLEIADKIKSKFVSAKSAATSLRRRINHKNPNVQLLALKLTDTCVKNSGHHFLQEVASREFMDNIVSLARLLGGNTQVRQKALELIQAWGIAFKSKPDLSYVCELYEVLKREGTQFPPVENHAVSAAIIDTQTAPEWTDSDICMRCRTLFTTFNRKHHCRNCGQTFCNDCSSKRMPLPHLGVADAVRVCESCFAKLTSKALANATNGGNNASLSSSGSGIISGNQPSTASTVSSDLARKEEEDLARAIAASLATSGASESNASRQELKSALKKPGVRFKDEEPIRKENDSDEDEDLKRAIAESLKTAQTSSGARTSSIGSKKDDYGSSWSYSGSGDAQQSAGNSSAKTTSGSNAAPAMITPTEIDNIRLFAELVERTEADVTARGISVLNPSQLQSLYAQVEPLQSKLQAALEHAAHRYKTLYDMNEQIGDSVRAYDQFLQQRLAASQQQAAPYGFVPAQPIASAGYFPPQQSPAPNNPNLAGTHQWNGPHAYAGYAPQQSVSGNASPAPQYLYGAPAPAQFPPYGNAQDPAAVSAAPPQTQPYMPPSQQQPQQPAQQQPVVQEAPLIEL